MLVGILAIAGLVVWYQGANEKVEPIFPVPSVSVPHEAGFFIIGNDLGMLRPCGCSKPVLGGIARRGAFFKSVEADVWQESQLICVGNLIKEGGRQQELKVEAFLDSLRVMEAAVFCPGDKDLLVGGSFWQEIVAARKGEGFPIVSANLTYEEKLLFSSHTVLRRGKEEVVVTGFVSPTDNSISEPRLVATAQPDVTDLLKALRSESGNPARHLLVAATGSLSEIEKLIEELGLKDAAKSTLVVLAGVSDIPVVDVRGKGFLGVESGQKGRYVGFTTWPRGDVLDHYTLDDSYGEDKEQAQILDFYRGNVKFEELLVQVPRFDDAEGNYAGSESCAACHAEAHTTWNKSKHATAFAALKKTGDEWDPECVRCHVVDFDRFGGFDPVSIDPVNIQCEACHGPSLDHVDQLVPTPRGVLGESFCFKCHDLANSPHFTFEAYWPQIAHTKK